MTIFINVTILDIYIYIYKRWARSGVEGLRGVGEMEEWEAGPPVRPSGGSGGRQLPGKRIKRVYIAIYSYVYIYIAMYT